MDVGDDTLPNETSFPNLQHESEIGTGRHDGTIKALEIEIFPSDTTRSPDLPLTDPQCYGMSELADASQQRASVSAILQRRAITLQQSSTHISPSSAGSFPEDETFEHSALFTHLAHGLALTTGSALGNTPPSLDTCLATYLVPNRAKLTAGSRAWAKHSHRSQLPPEENAADRANRARSEGWWGSAKGPVAVVNEKSLALFWKIMHGATWQNLHWLPHQVLVYEVRVAEGYGMRWSQDQPEEASDEGHPWMFRGFLEPTMENGHELKWRHPIPS